MLCFKLACLLLVLSNVTGDEEHEAYSNSWAIEVQGGHEAAKRLADKHGFIHMGQVSVAALALLASALVWLLVRLVL